MAEEAQQIYKDPDIIFIGAGPVGLWTAIQVMLRSHADKQPEILFFEKTKISCAPIP